MRSFQSLLEDGASQFNQGAYFQAHETWESVWVLLDSDHPIRKPLQGSIQLAVCLVHLGRDNPSGALRQWEKARLNFEGSSHPGILQCCEAVRAKIQGESNSIPVYPSDFLRLT